MDIRVVNPSTLVKDGQSTHDCRVGQADSLWSTMGIYTEAKTHARPPSDKNNRTDTRRKRRESRRVSSEVTAQQPQARLVDSGWLMGTRSRVSGKLAGSSESGPKVPSVSTGREGRAQSYHRSACPHSRVGAVHQGPSTKRTALQAALTNCLSDYHYYGAATGCTPLTAPAGRLHTRVGQSRGHVYAARQRPVRCAVPHIHQNISACGPRTSKLPSPSLLKP